MTERGTVISFKFGVFCAGCLKVHHLGIKGTLRRIAILVEVFLDTPDSVL
jgi:hypothetical protein